MTHVVGPNPATGGSDWVVGDVHGCFQTLCQALRAISFEYGRDRLFSVGDLIDRGPNSNQALEWLEGERFEAVVMGNHEAEMIRLLQTGDILAPTKSYQQWMRDIEGPELYRWYRALRPLPLAVTVETAEGQVGIVHCNTWHDSWIATIEALEVRDIEAINMVLLGIDERHQRVGPTGRRGDRNRPRDCRTRCPQAGRAAREHVEHRHRGRIPGDESAHPRPDRRRPTSDRNLRGQGRLISEEPGS